MSHPSSLLSIERTNLARSRSRRSRSSQNLMAQTCWAFNARLAPSFRPAFHGRCSLATGSYSECPIALHLLATVGQVMIERRARDEGGREWRKKGRRRCWAHSCSRDNSQKRLTLIRGANDRSFSRPPAFHPCRQDRQFLRGRPRRGAFAAQRVAYRGCPRKGRRRGAGHEDDARG